MIRSFVTIAAWTAVAVAMILVWSLLVAPARRDLDTAIERVSGHLFADMDRRIPTLASRRDYDTLREMQGLAIRGVKEGREVLEGVNRGLDAWFPQLTDVGRRELPKRDDFQQKYRFARDQLRRDIRDALDSVPGSSAALRHVTTIPLIEAAFEAERRLPKSTELAPAQRVFNIQRRVLLAAAKGGAVPISAPKVIRNWGYPEGPRGRLVEEKVVLELLVSSARLPHMLRKLLSLDGRGPVTRLDSLKTHPMKPPEKLEADEVPPIVVEVSLILTVHKYQS